MQRILVEDFTLNGWSDPATAESVSQRYASHLEAGNILFFPAFPFPFPETDRACLLSIRQSTASYHKNIAYRPHQDKLTGIEHGTPKQDELLAVLRRFSLNNVDFVGKFLARYMETWRVDYASFRPLQEKGRRLSQHSRNDLIHIDAFPSRPTNGDRILRVFSNISPDMPRVWVTTDPFDVIAPQHAVAAGLTPIANRAKTRDGSSPWARFAARKLGIRKLERSHYDEFMLGFHDYLKGNQSFQENTKKYQWEFPPLTTWMCFLDTVPHAVISGQYALEQTLIVSRRAMIAPEKTPASILEQLAGVKLTY